MTACVETTGLSSYNKHQFTHKAGNIYHLALYRKPLLTPDLTLKQEETQTHQLSPSMQAEKSFFHNHESWLCHFCRQRVAVAPPLEILTHSIHSGRRGVPCLQSWFSLPVVPVSVGMGGTDLRWPCGTTQPSTAESSNMGSVAPVGCRNGSDLLF